MTKIPVGVLGATGMVGQQYIALLANHPWFEVRHIAASAASAGKTFLDATRGRLLHRDAPLGLTVADAGDVGAAKATGIAFVFSAIELEKSALRALEEQYAAAGIPVISNSSAHRWTGDVPMLIAEINPQHCGIITAQRARRGWDKGFIAVKPNCSIQSYMTPLWALMRAGYEIQRMIVSTMQAVSGAGYPGVPSLDMIDNLVPFINGEEEKTEQEPLKIFGRIENGEIVNAGLPQI
ncbi:MAG: aspartate-semialdehyde dehydrogenase, partial [Rickettsiales bacterium]|nr:aspartate-semialdehyde dehydrogenase [Rickettsiales bacterium]